MALFLVNRYLGEDSEVNNNSKNDDGLEKLLEKIDERRKLKLKKLGDFNHLDSDSGESVKSINETSLKIKTNKDKRKKNNLNGNSVGIGDGININDTELPKENKKLKKKRKLNESDLDESAVKQEKRIKKVKASKYNSVDNTDTDVNISKDDEEIVDNSETELNICHQPVVPVKSKLKNKRKLVETESSISREGQHANDDKTESKKAKKRKKVSDENVSHNNLNLDTYNDEASSSSQVAQDVSMTSDNANNKLSEFTVIGGHNFKHKKPVNWLLPEWLSKPITISGSLTDSSAVLENLKGLDESLINSLRKNNIKFFFPVQRQVIPWVLSETDCSGPGLRFWPRDICVSAPTGSGKTLSFVLPIIQRLKKRLKRRIGALVVVPVQDLAAQVAQVFTQYVVGTGLQVLSVTGKKMPLQQEQKLLVYNKTGVGYESLVDIMVTTPGRLVEHIKETRGFSLHHLKFLVIDEADRVIDNIKNDWLYHLENHISSGVIGAVPHLSLYSLKNFSFRPQKLLFSATLTQDPEKLKQINLFQPRLFRYKASHLPENESSEPVKTEDDLLTNQVMKPIELEEMWVKCSTQLKPLIFYHILAEKKWRGVLCFTHFADATHRLTRLLRHLSSRHGLNLTIEEISSQRSFNDRHRILNDFRARKIDVLVCTDVYARGMDILEVRYVVLYSPPVHTRNYIHQVGRTARAGMKGTALTLLIPPQVKSFHKMLKGTGHANLTELKISETDLSYLEKPYKKALRLLKKETIKEKETSKEQAKTTKRKNFISHKRNIIKNNRNSSKKKLKQFLKNRTNKGRNFKSK